MRADGKSTRIHERISTDLPLQVLYRDTADCEWEETTHAWELTQSGAGFSLTRPVETGRLVLLTLPMPRNLRAFDYQQRQYQVWAIIRHVRTLPADTPNHIHLAIGTAFIGKQPPSSFLTDPTTRYDLRPALMKDGLWSPRVQLRNSWRFALPLEESQTIAANVCLEAINDQGQVSEHREAETQTVSEIGASVITDLNPDTARFLRVTSERCKGSLLAVIRGRRELAGNRLLLNLELMGGEWPV